MGKILLDAFIDFILLLFVGAIFGLLAIGIAGGF